MTLIIVKYLRKNEVFVAMTISPTTSEKVASSPVNSRCSHCAFGNRMFQGNSHCFRPNLIRILLGLCSWGEGRKSENLNPELSWGTRKSQSFPVFKGGSEILNPLLFSIGKTFETRNSEDHLVSDAWLRHKNRGQVAWKNFVIPCKQTNFPCEFEHNFKVPL